MEAVGQSLNVDPCALCLFMQAVTVNMFKIDFDTINHLMVLLERFHQCESLRNNFCIPSGMLLMFIQETEFFFGLLIFLMKRELNASDECCKGVESLKDLIVELMS